MARKDREDKEEKRKDIHTMGSLDWSYRAKSSRVFLGGGLGCGLAASDLAEAKTCNAHAQSLHFGGGLLTSVGTGSASCRTDGRGGHDRSGSGSILDRDILSLGIVSKFCDSLGLLFGLLLGLIEVNHVASDLLCAKLLHLLCAEDVDFLRSAARGGLAKRRRGGDSTGGRLRLSCRVRLGKG